jgi:hypothetical protein
MRPIGAADPREQGLTEKNAARNPTEKDMTMATKTLATALTATVLATQLAAPIASADERRDSANPYDSGSLAAA